MNIKKNLKSILKNLKNVNSFTIREYGKWNSVWTRVDENEWTIYNAHDDGTTTEPKVYPIGRIKDCIESYIYGFIPSDGSTIINVEYAA